MRWPRRPQSQPADTCDANQPPPTELESQLAEAVLSTAKAIRDGWAAATGKDSMPAEARVIVLVETWWFLLHTVDRIAFGAFGEADRDRLVDALVPSVAANLVTSMHHHVHSTRGTDYRECPDRVFSTAEAFMDGFNEATFDYGSCSRLAGDPSAERMTDLRGETVIGKLGARIARDVGQEHNAMLRLLVLTAAMHALARAGLQERVLQACTGT